MSRTKKQTRGTCAWCRHRIKGGKPATYHGRRFCPDGACGGYVRGSREKLAVLSRLDQQAMKETDR